MKRLFLSLLFCLYSLILFGQTLKIGVLGTTSGTASGYGISQQRGVMLAVDRINALGGINGSRVEMIAYDDEGSEQKASLLMLRLAYKDKVNAVIGTASSALTMSIARIAQRAKIPLITCISTHPRICEQNFNFVFRNLPNDNYQVREILKYMLLKGKTNIGLIFLDTAYGKSGRGAIEKYAEEMSIPILHQEGIAEKNETDLSGKLKRLKDAGVENLIVWTFYADGAEIVKTAGKERLSFEFYGGDGLVYPDFITQAEGYAEGTIVTLPYDYLNPDPINQQFVSDYQDKFGTTPDSFASYAYDAVLILENAMENGGDPFIIRSFLSNTKNVIGVTGITSFDEKGDDTKPVLIGIVKDGEFVVVQ